MDTKFSFQVCKRLKQLSRFFSKFGEDWMDQHRHALELKSCYFVKVNDDDPWKAPQKNKTKQKTALFGFQNQNSKNCVILCLCQLTVATPISCNHYFINVLR